MATTILDVVKGESGKRELVFVTGRILGETTGPTATKDTGDGWTVAYSATGIYTVTFTNTYASFVGCVASLTAATPGDLAGHTVIQDTFASNGIPFHVYNAADAAHAIVDDEYLQFVAVFKRQSA